MIVLVWFVAINTALALLYAIVRLARHKGAGIALLFIFLPGLGFLLYFLPSLSRGFSKEAGVDREAVLTHAFQIERQPEHPDVREALDVVPVEDAMAISGNAEKRALLLKQLKKSLHENYKILLAAEEDEDSESVHYMAAAKMEIYRLQQARWLECRRDYEQDPDDPEMFHMACAVLAEMLESGVLSVREQNAYRKQLCDLSQGWIDSGNGELLSREYEEYLRSLVELGRYDDAERLWRQHGDQMRSEDGYQEMFRMYYRMGNRVKFEELLDSLRKNRQVRLSAQGLEHLRYWMDRLARTAVEK